MISFQTLKSLTGSEGQDGFLFNSTYGSLFNARSLENMAVPEQDNIDSHNKTGSYVGDSVAGAV